MIRNRITTHLIAAALRLALIAVFALGAAASASADPACQLAFVSTVDMGLDDAGGVTIPVTIAGHNFDFLVDTGGVLSMATQSTVDTLGLQPRAIGGNVRMTMFGGTRIDHFVVAKDFSVGGTLRAAEVNLMILPGDFLAPGDGGTFAPDYLRSYDVDFDFAKAKFNLVSSKHCPGKVIYWTKDPVAEVPMLIDEDGHITISVEIDGKKFRATIDTGASRSVMSLETAEDYFKLTPTSPGMTRVNSPGGASDASYTYPFKALAFPGIAVNNPDITLVPDKVSKMGGGGPDLIIGIGLLRRLHVYLAYNEKVMYLTPATAH